MDDAANNGPVRYRNERSIDMRWVACGDYLAGPDQERGFNQHALDDVAGNIWQSLARGDAGGGGEAGRIRGCVVRALHPHKKHHMKL
jgi:hypothetical protein